MKLTQQERRRLRELADNAGAEGGRKAADAKYEKKGGSRKRGTGYLFRRAGCQTWTIQYYQEGRRKRERTGTTDKAAAQRLLTKRLYQINQGELVEPEVKPVRVEQLWQAMIDGVKAEGRKTKDYNGHWRHLRPVFGLMQARRVTAAMLQQYAQQRKREFPLHRPNQVVTNATVNKEIGSLLHCLRLGQFNHPTLTVPKVRKLKEDNVRTGFIDDAQFATLAGNADALWLRTFLELGYSYGFRHGELLGLTCQQIDLAHNTIRLEPGTTKNREGRHVVMTGKVRALVEECVRGRIPADPLLRRNGEPVRDVRWAWQTLCAKSGLATLTCRKCKETVPDPRGCPRCKTYKGIAYKGLLVHDLRRSAAKALRLAGVPESTIMKIGGWKTAAMFRRYAIDSQRDQQQAVELLEAARARQATTQPPPAVPTIVPNPKQPQRVN